MDIKKEILQVRISQEFRRLRNEAGLTQAKTAERLGVTAAAVSLFEGGRQMVTVHKFLEVVTSLGGDPVDSLRRVVEENPADLTPDHVEKLSKISEVVSDPEFSDTLCFVVSARTSSGGVVEKIEIQKLGVASEVGIPGLGSFIFKGSMRDRAAQLDAVKGFLMDLGIEEANRYHWYDSDLPEKDFRDWTEEEFIGKVENSSSWDAFEPEVYEYFLDRFDLNYYDYEDPDVMWEAYLKSYDGKNS